MKQSFLLCLIFFTCSLSAEPSRELLFKLNSSVVKVNVATKSGAHGVGSGVVVARDHIVTNCHVIADAQGVHVTKYGYSFSPHALLADWENDICILKFKYLELDPVKLGNNKELKYEQEVFGKSYGGNTIKAHTSYGRVKGIHRFSNNKIIQSSAWFAIGASGGGLFNQNGELIGVTTFKTAGNSGFYYSMPVEIIKRLLSEGKELSVTTQPKLPFWDAPENKQPYFMQVVGPLKQQNWKKLKTISYAWHKSEPESIEAHSNYALALFKLGDTIKSEEELKKIAKRNPNFVQSFLYLYEIAKLKKNKQDAAKYKSIVFSLDETIIVD
tara:strand:+ start:71539 stop:72519 length:981 start_codon:yes stop_codon:yes gene_type:complete